MVVFLIVHIAFIDFKTKLYILVLESKVKMYTLKKYDIQ